MFISILSFIAMAAVAQALPATLVGRQTVNATSPLESAYGPLVDYGDVGNEESLAFWLIVILVPICGFIGLTSVILLALNRHRRRAALAAPNTEDGNSINTVVGTPESKSVNLPGNVGKGLSDSTTTHEFVATLTYASPPAIPK
ncbi:uncharacterized protein EHS24_006178 [Apiotrichum porosum]|uniref:Uncharacterized protein n=1 Tax=Apiotrichum porosum TaxID=105984 RepID=A0A427Y0I6_9TREE|nr:uncharacterized protein EHS24_006178 [Apiotrichum porosum]RSH84654.1 hypothetical protein EHS24_006178 [Apiotrichum porosum]